MALLGPKLCGASKIACLLGPERQEVERVKRVSRGDKAGQPESSPATQLGPILGPLFKGPGEAKWL